MNKCNIDTWLNQNLLVVFHYVTAYIEIDFWNIIMQYCLLLHTQEVKLENNTHDVYLSLSHKYYDVQYERLECEWSIRIIEN